MINRFSLLVCGIILSFLINLGFFSANALVPSDISDQVFFLDAQNIDGDNNSGNEPLNNALIPQSIDTFNSYTGFQDTPSKQPIYKINSLNTFPSLEFDGATQYLNITDNQTINTGPLYSQKSISMILKTGSDISSFQTVYEEGGKEKGFSIQIDGGKLYTGAYNTLDWPSQDQFKTIDLGTIEVNTIYTVILIFDSDNDFLNGYINGLLIGTLTNISTQTTHGSCIFDTSFDCSMYNTGETSIGLGATKNDVVRLSSQSSIEVLEGNHFGGNIGEISSWNTALSAVEVIGLNEYYQNKWFPDSEAPKIISTNFGNNQILPGGNHEIIFNYDDFHEGSSGIDITTSNITFEKWNGTTWYGIVGLGSGAITTNSAIYQMNAVSYGKYKASFSISDNAGNSSMTKELIFYVDIPEMTISTGIADIGIVNPIGEAYAGDITVTVRTIGAPFRVQLKKNQLLTKAGDTIPYYNGTSGFGFDRNNNSTIDDIGTNEIVGSEGLNLNTLGQLNTYTYIVKVGTIINAQQVAGDYSGLVDFGIDFDYLSEYISPTIETSCKTLVDKYGTNIGNGIYTINPGTGNVNVYCDMLTAGGGWTMIKRVGKLGRNGKPTTDRIGIMANDSQMGLLTNLVPSGTEFAKMSDILINSIAFGEVMLHQDTTGDRVFVIDTIIDSDYTITQSDGWVYKKELTGLVKKSVLNSINNGCVKFGIYITEDTSLTLNGGGYGSCEGSMIVSNGGYIHTINSNGFGLNQTSVYTNSTGDEWVR